MNTRKTFAVLFGSMMLLNGRTASAVSLNPLYSASAGAVKQVSATWGDVYSYTAVINGSGNLEIIYWNDTGSALTRAGSVTVGAAKSVAVVNDYFASSATDYLVTALVNGSSRLELIAWTINFDGSLTRAASYTSSLTATAVSITVLEDGTVATASRNTSGKLDVNDWIIGSTITPSGAATAGTVSQVAIAGFLGQQFVTCIRDSSGDLNVISWVHQNGQVFRQSTAKAGAIQHVVAAPSSANGDVYTALINSSGDLEMIDWAIDGSGGITRLGSFTGEAASQVGICDFCYALLPYGFTAIANAAGDLAAELWSLPPSTLTEATYYDTSSPVSTVTATVTTDDNIMTAARDNNGNLQVQAWGYTN